MANDNEINNLIDSTIKEHHVAIFAKSYCPHCKKVKELFSSLNVPFYHLDLDLMDNGEDVQEALATVTGQKTVPQVFIGERFVGGNSDVQQLHGEGHLLPLVAQQ